MKTLIKKDSSLKFDLVGAVGGKIIRKIIEDFSLTNTTVHEIDIKRDYTLSGFEYKIQLFLEPSYFSIFVRQNHFPEGYSWLHVIGYKTGASHLFVEIPFSEVKKT